MNEAMELSAALIDHKSVVVTRVSNGWNVRFKKSAKPAPDRSPDRQYEPLENYCLKCRRFTQVYYHHVVSKGAGGGDDFDNKIPLCEDCHTGNNGLHAGKWKIEEVVPEYKLAELKIRYNVRRQ